MATHLQQKGVDQLVHHLPVTVIEGHPAHHHSRCSVRVDKGATFRKKYLLRCVPEYLDSDEVLILVGLQPQQVCNTPQLIIEIQLGLILYKVPVMRPYASQNAKRDESSSMLHPVLITTGLRRRPQAVRLTWLCCVASVSSVSITSMRSALPLVAWRCRLWGHKSSSTSSSLAPCRRAKASASCRFATRHKARGERKGLRYRTGDREERVACGAAED